MPLTGEYLPGTSEWARTQAEAFEATSGHEANELRGKPIIVLTSVGAKTGGLRKTALMRVEHDGSYLAVASRGGSPTPPAWYWNVRKNPLVELQDGERKREYRAHEADGVEYDLWWQRALAAWPDYAAYQKKTTRRIALFVLEPVAD
ncbi:nitroreductase family deazaflavin-dependent oxidoreductase [Microbacterium sp. RD1]|uniref:nitroreductase family deazaflavin-dependent oxidoreductase n=1 Tax=Microbacterium sp. RD1 TaxID=3457313 RepID=UPI003FA59F63